MPLFKSRANFNGPDIVLLVVVSLILIFGLIMLSSASAVVGMARFGESNFFIKRQLIALVPGLVLAWCAYKIDYRKLQKNAFPIFAGSIALLLLVFFPVVGVGSDASRWINFGFFTFQPSELVKLTLIIYLSAWFSQRGHKAVSDLKSGLIPFVILMIILFVLIISQPDLGTLLVICCIGMSIYFAAGANIKHFIGLILSSIGILALAIKLAPYRLARITAFFNPSLDPQKTTYHITQALIAVGSGGIFGLGLGQSRQKFLYLPEVTGDSLFAVIAEELGFIGAIALIILFLLFFWRACRIAKRTPDNFSKLVVVGITVWVVGQAFINIGAMTKVLPLTGVPLPLMSYGGSALVITMAAIGLLLNISKTSRV